MSKIIIIGVDRLGLTDEQQTLLASCRVVFATERFRPLLIGSRCEVLPITPLSEALTTIGNLLRENITVGMLASGDPLFYGIGQTVINKFGKGSVEIHPAVSSMQLAFSRIKKSWQDAHIVSLHGRNTLPMSVLRHHTVFLFTDKNNTPARIAQQLSDRIADSSGYFHEEHFWAYVLENLGMPDEIIRQGSLAQIAGTTFGDLNVMIILAEDPPSIKGFSSFGLSEQDIQHSRGLITKDEVRAIVLHKLALPENGVFWDIGAGSGSISVEAARLNPLLQIYAIEQNTDEHRNIAVNRTKFCLDNMHLIQGQAPEALANLPRPDRIFIGGSGGKLAAIITHASPRLADGGRIIITAVTDATRQIAPRLLHENGFVVEISNVQVTRSIYPSDNQSTVQLNPITIITGRANDR
jgi:precorrin-6Y C5,15-methyltransferase (decarboxylating)